MDKSAPSKESLERARWFVMLYGNDGTPIPMMRDEDNVALFDSEGEASKCALANPLGELYGYETFEWILS